MTPDLVQYLVMGMAFFAAVLAVFALAPLFATKVDLRARLSTVASAPAAGGRAAGLRNDNSASLWAKLVQEVERRGLSLKDTKADALSERLMLAGYDQPHAVRVFVLTRTVLTLAIPALALLAMLVVGFPSPTRTYFYIFGAALLGMFLPNFIVNSKGTSRRTEILNGFPDTLDLMLVCVEAGLGIDACFTRVGSEITKSHPLLARLFALVSLELRAGRTREIALKGLSRRTAVPEIGAFVTLIIQSDKLGSSIAQALKIYANEMREARRMRAEEKAHRLPVLLSVPLVLFLLPTMVSVLMLPAAISMRDNMATMSRAK